MDDLGSIIKTGDAGRGDSARSAAAEGRASGDIIDTKSLLLGNAERPL